MSSEVEEDDGDREDDADEALGEDVQGAGGGEAGSPAEAGVGLPRSPRQKTVEGERGPEADDGVGQVMRVKRKMPKLESSDERGVEAGAGAAEACGGRRLRRARARARTVRASGRRAAAASASGRVCAEELARLHARGHRPVEERRFFEVADAVGVERDVVVAEQHLAGDFGVDGVGVVEQRRREEGEAGVEDDPEHERW